MSKLMQQYRAIKEKYPDTILLFRVGDFYETFGEDAKKAADILGGLFLETRNPEGEGTVFSIPYYSLHVALSKLIKAGYKVGICDQLEDPKTVRGLAKRGVTDLFN